MEFRVCRSCRKAHGGETSCPSCHRPLHLAGTELFEGETFGKYRITSVLGAGGMGVVYRAVHATLGRPVALKLVVPGTAGADFEKRFLREARLLAELHHPNIVEIFDFDVSEWGLPFTIMELLEGCTLRTLLLESADPLPLPLVSAILDGLAAGLVFAHGKGIVHRDLKPENVFLAVHGSRVVVKLLDFGLAKLLTADPAEGSLTRSGIIAGTPNYLAPEQALDGVVGPATDQYALALIVAELLSGIPVRSGRSMSQILSVDLRRALSLTDLPRTVPPAAAGAISRATEPDPAARFSDVLAFSGARAPVPG